MEIVIADKKQLTHLVTHLLLNAHLLQKLTIKNIPDVETMRRLYLSEKAW